MAIARTAVGAPMVVPPKAAPAALKSLMEMSSSQVERTPQLPTVPWATSVAAVGAAQSGGLGTPLSDTGRLKMEGIIDDAEVIVHLQAALQDSTYGTTVTLGGCKALTFGPPRYMDRSVSRLCESAYNDPREVYIKREKQLKWVCSSDPYGSSWHDESATPWAYYERRLIRQTGGAFATEFAPIISRVHWLYSARFEWNCDPQFPKPSASNLQSHQVIWYCDPRQKLLRWRKMSHWMQTALRHLERERGRRLAESLSNLTGHPVVGPPELPGEVNAIRLVDMHHIAPQSWFNIAMNIMLYRDDHIPEEEFETHTLDPRDANHVAILAQQTVERCGVMGLVFPEHFYWRYFDYKLKAQAWGFTVDQLKVECIGIELYLMYLQTAGYIKIFNDTIETDPYGRNMPVRLIQAAVIRGYKKAQKNVVDGLTDGQVTGRKVRHGTHAFTVAAILEAGGPKGSRNPDEHEFTTPGLYTCPDGELSPLGYATRARIVMHHDLQTNDNVDISSRPCAQFVFRGDELIDGDRNKKVKSFGEDSQWIYREDHHVNWTELQVWIGVPLSTKDHVGLFACAPCFDGSRRCTRLFRVGEWNVGGVQYTKFKGTTSSTKLEDPFPVVSASSSPANTRPEGWELAVQTAT